MSNTFNNSKTYLHNVTFIIGNGFDISLGMKTKYTDMYESYIKTPSNSGVIKEFKKALQNDKKYDKWSDFEMGMAEYAKILFSEDELVECVRDFKKHMVQHLRNEDKMISDIIRNSKNSLLYQDLTSSFKQFHMGFSPNVINEFRKTIDEPFLKYNVITFNYTRVLDELIKLYNDYNNIPIDEPLHIHGSLHSDVVLGVDNMSQLQSTSYRLSKKGKRAFVKTMFNEEYDKARVAAATKMISDSSIICTYGYSMGKSDETWCKQLVEWLLADKNHHLVVFQHSVVEYERYNFDEIMDTEETKKENLANYLGLYDYDILEQIHIPVGYDIFNFRLKTDSSNPILKPAAALK